MDGNGRTRTLPLCFTDCKLILARRLPPSRPALTRFTRDHHNAVCNDKRGIETHAELPDQLTILLLIAAQLLHESGRARFGDGAQIVHHLIAGHTNTVVIDGDGFGVGVCAHANPVISAAGKAPIANYRESMFIDCVRRIRDQLPQEDFPIGIERMNHEVKQTLRLGLKAHSLGRISCHDRFPCFKCIIEVLEACQRCGGSPQPFQGSTQSRGQKKAHLRGLPNDSLSVKAERHLPTSDLLKGRTDIRQ